MYENLQLDDANFVIGMQAGTFASIDSSDQALKVKNQGGAQVGPLYSLSSNINNTLKSFDYVGPISHNDVIDKAPFFTLEKVSSTQCQIKRWELDPTGPSLDLKNTVTKTTGASDYYNVEGMAVEFYRRSFDNHNPGGIDYLDINSAGKISSGTKLFLGPSSDLDNEDVTEYVTVDTVSGTRVYLTSNISNEYVDGDDITFYKNIYLISSLGFNGDISKGTIFKLNPDTGAVLERNYEGFYQSVSACKWSSYVQAVACVSSTNMLFVRPYDSYQNWKSMYLSNVEDDTYTVFDVHDIEFNDYEVYKLMSKVTLVDDDGNKSTYNWSDYNFRQDSLLPYTSSVGVYLEKSKMIGTEDETTTHLQVRDQFGVGLLNVDVDVDVESGDLGAALDPVDGKVVTDSDGKASVDYTSGLSYEGMTNITAKADGGFTGHGSQYVWNSNHITSDLDVDFNVHLYQEGDISIEANILRQISNEVGGIYKIFCKTFFTAAGGDWVNPSAYSGEVSTYLPALIVGNNDGPQSSFHRDINDGVSNNIKQVLNFESNGYFRQIGENFTSTSDLIKQIGEKIPTISGAAYMADSFLTLDQLKLSQHTYWVGGTAYDYLWTMVNFNQFVFVEDAIPAFFSEKNSIDTDIWIRLRPFAYDLNSSTLKFMVRETSYAGDTGYRDFTPYCTINSFDAGGGIDGLDILCDPPNNFHHDSVVYVHIEVYDDAPVPNYIYVDYWFTVIPDYRFPYLENLNPDREQTDVSVDTDVYFEVKDQGIGVDINSLELLVNSKKAEPLTIEKVDSNHYKITYNTTTDFYYNKEVSVSVKVSDLSENENTLVDSYKFYTIESSGIEFIPLNPRACKRGFPRFQDVEFLVLAEGNGIDTGTLRVQIHNKDVTDKVNILPVIYRTS